MTADWLYAFGIACLVFAGCMVMALVAQYGVYELRRRRRIAALRARRVRARVMLPAASPSDWVWPMFPERIAAQLEADR